MKNEYQIDGNVTHMVLCHKDGSEKSRTTIDSEDVGMCSEIRWCDTNGYVTSHKRIGGERTVLRLHDHLLGFNGNRKIQIDHINRDALDNRKSNLRICTHQQNLSNNSHPVGESGFRGVYPVAGRWRAKIRYNGAFKQIGAFGTAIEAARAWNTKALELRGEFAVLNDV